MDQDKATDDVVITGNRVVGCRGRVLVAILVLVVLVLVAAATLFYTLFTQPPQRPARTASADAPATAYSALTPGDPVRPFSTSSLSAPTIASARSGDRPGPA